MSTIRLKRRLLLLAVKIMFVFEITSIKAGWLYTYITNENNEKTQLFASFLNDALKILLENLNNLAVQQNAVCVVYWQQEPGADIWRIRKEKDIVHYTIYRPEKHYVNGIILEQPDDFNFMCKFDFINQTSPIIILQPDYCYKILVKSDSPDNAFTLNLKKFTFDDKEMFEKKISGSTTFLEFYHRIVKAIWKYSYGKNLELYNHEWSNGNANGYKFPTDEFNKAVLILNECYEKLAVR